jgi:phosphoribosylformimino-5-aminoimidazole carboxamide ribotide isomerase
MVEGWLEEGGTDYLSAAASMEALGAGALIFTDISRDGTLSGPNLSQLAALKERTSCRIIASGGIKGIEDIRALKRLDIYGAICGKAVYSGDLDLTEAFKALSDVNQASQNTGQAGRGGYV